MFVATAFGGLRDFPTLSSLRLRCPEIVERSKDRMVEPNPKGTTALARCPRPRPFDKLKDLPRLPPQFVELVETNPEVTSAFAPPPPAF